MLHALLRTGLLASLISAAGAQEAQPVELPFPPSTALAEGVSPEALQGLSELVQGLVDAEEVVGAELLVLKNGRSILHEAYGWSNREDQVPMETGSVFCVRSMTKPLVAAAILMLIDDNQLELEDRVAEFLPSFDAEGTREITVEELLQHTTGLPMSLLLGKDLAVLDAAGGIRAVADLGGGYDLDFPPGTNFQYSDQGTDTATALVEIVSGMPAAEFVRTRLLEPLGMQHTTCVMDTDHPLRERAIPKYAGTRGSWMRFWSPDDDPLFPFFLGSQGLYSTLEDYALFLEFWERKGRARLSGNERLLATRYVKKALAPNPFEIGMPTGFPGLTLDYGYFMQLWIDEASEDEPELVAFGHTGSDGTHAWAFPEEDAMVLYFTQSRNNTTGLRVEEALGRLFLGAPFDPNQAAPPFEDYLGYYWEGRGDKYRAIVRDGEDLALEILGQAVVPLDYAGEDNWKFRPNPSVVVSFDRAETGEITGYHIGDHQEFRLEPALDLPSGDEMAELVARSHRLDLLESLGPLRLDASMNMEKLDIQGEVTTWLAWPGNYRVNTLAAGNFEHAAFDGTHATYASTAQPARQLTGPQAEDARIDNVFARFGDWRRSTDTIEVIQRLTGPEGEEVFLVRLGDTSAPARTLFVDWEQGRVFREERMTHVDNLGRIGVRVTFGDFRDVSGMQLPFRTEVLLAHPLIGPIVTEVSAFELGVELTPHTFSLQE